MNNIKVKELIFNNIKEFKQNMIILENKNLKNGEKIIIQNDVSGEQISAYITAKNIFVTLNDALKIFPLNLFGNLSLYGNLKDKIAVYRIKIDNNIDANSIIQDNKIFKLIDLNLLEEIKIGRSTSKVFKTKLKERDQTVILKIQYLPSRTSLKDEYERLVWLQNKISVPKIYYWNDKFEYKYLIMEYKNGIPAFKYNNIGYKLGEELRKIHNVNIKKCKFNNNITEKLLNNCLNKIDAIFPEIQMKYQFENINTVIKFLETNMPKDKVLTHGDYSLPNILIDKDIYNFIDLGDLSISTKYFDFYYFFRSLKINKKEYMWNDFVRGYGIKILNNDYMKWMDIIDKALY